MNKREFVLGSGGALVAGKGWAAVPPGAPQAGAVNAPAAAALPGSLAHWQARVGERFAVFGAAPPQHLLLQRVDARAGDALTSQFSLLFQSEGAAPASGAQVLRPDAGGALALFLAPAGTDARGSPLLRADFCHLA
ncbi:MAG: hypothetical protein KA141_04095 [Rubrivivax sp.]|nr:hypothetical protein [Rubrivivax sp.]